MFTTAAAATVTTVTPVVAPASAVEEHAEAPAVGVLLLHLGFCTYCCSFVRGIRTKAAPSEGMSCSEALICRMASIVAAMCLSDSPRSFFRRFRAMQPATFFSRERLSVQRIMQQPWEQQSSQ